MSGAVKQRPPSLIDGWLGPEARLLERHESRVAAPPERAYEAIRQVRLANMPIVRALFTMRRIPHSKEMTLLEFFSTRPFLILDEASAQEVVIGTAEDIVVGHFAIAGIVSEPIVLVVVDVAGNARIEMRIHVVIAGGRVGLQMLK